MDIRKVKKLIELLQESNLSELEITEGDDSVRISRNSPASPPLVTQHTLPVIPSVNAPARHKNHHK